MTQTTAITDTPESTVLRLLKIPFEFDVPVGFTAKQISQHLALSGHAAGEATDAALLAKLEADGRIATYTSRHDGLTRYRLATPKALPSAA